MGFHDNQLHVFGLLAKVQAAYNSPETLSTSDDGFLPYLQDRAPYANLISIDPQYDGANGVNIKTLFDQKRTQQRGFMFKGNIPHRFRGAGAVYSSGSVKPPWETMMRGAGFVRSTNSNTAIYTPLGVGVAQDILTIGAYMRGGKQLWPGMNCVSNLTIEGVGVDPPLVTFELMGVASAMPTTVAIPTITYPGESLAPPVGAGVTLNIGDFVAPVLKSWKFTAGRDIGTVMTDLTLSEGIVGPLGWGWKPRLTLVVASTVLKTADPWHDADQLNEFELRRLATEFPVALEWGAVDELGNHCKIDCTSAQVESMTTGNEGPVATTELVLQLNDFTISHESEPTS